MTRTRREQEISDLDALYVAICQLAHYAKQDDKRVVVNAREAYARISQRLQDSIPLGPRDAR